METEIEEVGSDEHRCLINDMEAMLEKTKLPELVPNCCIYKVPQKIRETNPVAYTPRVVSIGPLHHGNERLEVMKELKFRYLKCFLGRTDMKLEYCIRMLKEKEGHIRDCYAATIPQSSDDFVRMILIDACFIIEYMLRFNGLKQWIKIDPILSKPNRWHDMRMDLILLENQLPFFVLEDFFTLICRNGSQYSSFLEVSFHYFRILYNTNAKLENDEFTFDYFRERHLKKRSLEGENCVEVEVQHLTDLLRIFYLPCGELQPKRVRGYVKHLYSASQLLEAGVKFKVSQNKSLIELQFDKGVLTMPHLMVNYDTEIFLRNMAALEQCHYPYETYIGDYLVLLDFLINDRKDADILVEKGIMFNILGDNDKVVAIFNNICRGMSIANFNVDHVNPSENLKDFYEKPLHKYKAIFIHDYFSTPWKIASFIAAIVLLLLTMIQTICSIISLL